jgi:hypothetical protein
MVFLSLPFTQVIFLTVIAFGVADGVGVGVGATVFSCKNFTLSCGVE